jgi:hypothetical protein
MRRTRVQIGAAVLGAALLGSTLLGAPAFGLNAPGPRAGGAIQVYAESQSSGGTVVITGVIGDSGTTTPINARGKVDAGGNYVRFNLKFGTFVVNLLAFAGKVNPPVNATNCSAVLTITAPAPSPLLDGTGAYKGITGSLTLDFTLAVVLPKYKSGQHKGQCNESSSVKPTGQLGLVTGSGVVSFS